MTICNTEGCKEQGYYNFASDLPSSSSMSLTENEITVDNNINLCVVIDIKKLFCKEHRAAGMICMSIKKCKEDGCIKQPNYNFPNEKRPIYCLTHKKPEMINIISKKCQDDDCNKIPNFNFPNEKNPIFCKKHIQRYIKIT